MTQHLTVGGQTSDKAHSAWVRPTIRSRSLVTATFLLWKMQTVMVLGVRADVTRTSPPFLSVVTLPYGRTHKTVVLVLS